MARFALALAGILTVLLALEAVLRVVTATPEVANPLYSFHQGDPDVGWVGRRGIRRRFVRPEFAVVVEHGEDGFRRPAPPPPAEPRERWLFLGDSFTWGWGVPQGQVYTDWLQREVAPRVAIHNRGVNGFSTAQEFLLLQRELGRRRYHRVAVQFVDNDVEDNVDGKRGRRPYFLLVDGRLVPHNQPPDRLMSPLRRFLKDESRAFLWLDFRWNLLRRAWKQHWKRRQAFAPAAPGSTAEIDFRSLPGYPETARVLGEMKRACGARGASFGLIYVPAKGEYLSGEVATAEERAIRTMVLEITRREAIPLIDLAAPFREAARAGRTLKFRKDNHWTADGHRLAAETIRAAPMFAEGRGAE